MKKRYVAIISICTASLLFGGLVYCGISAFPELLKPEEEEAPKEEQRLLVGIVDTYHHYETQAKEEQNITLFVGGSSNNDHAHHDKGVSFSFFDADKVTIIEAKDTGKNSIRKESIARDEVSFAIVNAPVVEVAPASEKVTHSETKVTETKVTPYTYQNSIRNETPRKVTYVNKEQKEEALNVEVTETKTTHKEFLECSLLVVGAVEILSFILVKRRKFRMFR